MVTLSPAYSITIKVGEKLFAGHVDNSLAIVPQYEPILRKSLGGRFDLDFVSVDLDMRISGLTYERTSGEAATHNDFADLRAACSSPVSVAFVYGAIVPGNIVLTGNAKLSEYQETAGAGKISGQWSCRLRSVRGSVQEEVVPPAVQDVKYGLLYNWPAATDARYITAIGWHLSSRIEWVTLSNYLGGDSVAGGKLKETGVVYWLTPNTGASNEVQFNARGSGIRNISGAFNSLQSKGCFWTSYSVPGYPALAVDVNIQYNQASIDTLQSTERIQGMTLRPVKDSTALTHGQVGSYTGNDGRVYRTICIGTQEWLADNLCETKFRNGDSIPEVTGNAAWAALTTAGMCAYNNDWSNV
jgi:uncharacterized protein (TIGR02145 family)